MKTINPSSFVDALHATRATYQDNYLAMYSSVLNGVVTDPTLMLLPMDDHMVHRGDGVFEAFKCVEGCIYNIEAHLARMHCSAAAVFLDLPRSDAEIMQTVVEAVRAGGSRNAIVRLYVSRGPGGFGASPSESPRPQLYVVVTRMPDPFMVVHPEGARVAMSEIPPKDPVFARIKSTNYMINVLMKRESREKGVDFVVAFDANRNMTEGATENFGVVTAEGRLVFPTLEGTLRGTTMMRVIELAEALVERGELLSVSMEDVPLAAIQSAREMLIVGTTQDVAAVREFEGRPVGTGHPGPVYAALSQRLQDDMHNNRDRLTEVFP